MGQETAASASVTRHLEDGGYQTIYSCPAHVMQTVRQLGGQGLSVTAADQAVHRCKGCLDGWPPDSPAGG